MIRVVFFGELRRRTGVREVELSLGGLSLSEILRELANRYGLSDLIYRDGEVRGELLILVNGADWNSLGYLDKTVKDGSTIKLVPVWHGG